MLGSNPGLSHDHQTPKRMLGHHLDTICTLHPSYLPAAGLYFCGKQAVHFAVQRVSAATDRVSAHGVMNAVSEPRVSSKRGIGSELCNRCIFS